MGKIITSQLATAALLLFVSSLYAPAQATPDRLFDPGRLVEVKIEIDEEHWDSLRVESRNFVKVLSEDRRLAPLQNPFQYYPGAVTIDGVRLEGVGIRKKGFLGSLDSERPSLKIKFNQTDPGRRFAGLDRLTLNNNKQDRSQLSQFITYHLFEKAGLPAPRCNLARVWVNGVSLGIYSNVESIRRPFLMRVFGERSGTLFEGTVSDFYPDWTASFEFKRGNEREGRETIAKVAAILTEEGESIVAPLAAQIDLDSFFRYWALESLVGFWDGYAGNQNNYYFYQHSDSRRLHFIPWGADSAFGPGMFGPMPATVMARSLICNRLYQIPGQREKYHDILAEMLENVWHEDDLLALIDRAKERFEDHLHPSQRGSSGAIQSLKKFISTRREKVREENEDGLLVWEEPPSRPIYFKNEGTISASFDTTWVEAQPANPLQIGKAEISFENTDGPVEFTHLGAHATASVWPPNPGSPSLTLTGRRKSDGTILIFVLGVEDPKKFAPSGGESIEIGGVLMEGVTAFLNPEKMQMLFGTVVFDQARAEKDAPIRGRLDLNVVRMNMKMPRRQPE